jgi:hypothetical protein
MGGGLRMQELGRTQNVGRGAYTNNATPRKAVRDKGGGGRQFGQNDAAVTGIFTRKTVAETAADEWQNAPRKNLIDEIIEGGSEIKRSPKTAMSSGSHSAADYWKMDRSFGVEELSYKKMWKVLKTVVKEIGDIKEAASGQFFLGVSERLEKATTLMEFDLIIDNTEEEDQENRFRVEMVPPEATDGEAERVVADPEASLQAQANVVPERALRLLGGAK